MTAETLKPFITLPTGASYKKTSRNGCIVKIAVSLFLIVFCATLLGFTIWNSIRTCKIENEVKELNKIIDSMNKRLGLDLLDGLDEFEDEYNRKDFINNLHDENQDELDDSFEDEDEFEDDEDLQYDGEDDGSGDLETFVDELYDYELEKQHRQFLTRNRKQRSLISDSGVPVIEESYALKRNKSGDPSDYVAKILLRKTTSTPTLKYDWSDKGEHGHGRKHKKYMEARAQPERHIRLPPPLAHVNQENHDRMGSNQLRQGQVVITGSRRREIRPLHKSMEGRTRQGGSRSRNIAVHYNGDTSRYTPGYHEHYEGNGRLRHLGGVYTDWKAESWVDTHGMERHFRLENGIVTIRENGIYYVYAQIFYHDDHDTNGFVIEVNNQPFVQCTTMAHSTQRVTKSNTCFTGGMVFLKNGDTVRVSDLGNHRYTLLESSKSFFGLVRIVEGRVQHVRDEETPNVNMAGELRRFD